MYSYQFLTPFSAFLASYQYSGLCQNDVRRCLFLVENESDSVCQCCEDNLAEAKETHEQIMFE